MMISPTPELEIQRTLDALTCQLGDPHTWFIPARGARQLLELIRGQATTLPGFTLHRAEGQFVVGEVLSGSPAEASGLRPGDVVRSIVGKHVMTGMRDTFRISNHEEGTLVTLEVVRADEASTVELCVSSYQAPLTELRILDAATAYLRLRFVTASDQTDRDAGRLVARALASLAGSGIRNLVFDLRSNPGGYGVTGVASRFTRADPLLYYACAGGDDEPARNVGAEQVFEGRIVVLVDEQTLSSAEMIALVLRECADAKVVGQATAGGLNVPRRLMFANGDLLMVPERLALGPRSRACPPGMRLQPDVVVPNRTAGDFAAGRDPQLETAQKLLSYFGQ